MRSRTLTEAQFLTSYLLTKMTGSGGLEVIEDVPQDVGDDEDLHGGDMDAPEDVGDDFLSFFSSLQFFLLPCLLASPHIVALSNLNGFRIRKVFCSSVMGR